MKKFFITILTIIILTGISWFGYVAYDYVSAKNSLKFTPIPSITDSISTTTDSSLSTSNEIFATSTVDTSSWKNYTNDELGYVLKYPSDLIVNEGGATLILSFPKKTYFHWPLEDSVKITVTVSSNCASSTTLSDYGNLATSTLIVKNNKFNRYEVSDVGAGNVYKKILYETHNDNACYSLLHDSRGTNGSGFYVNDPVLIKKYDDQHLADVAGVTNSIYGILGTFNFRVTPDGELEK